MKRGLARGRGESLTGTRLSREVYRRIGYTPSAPEGSGACVARTHAELILFSRTRKETESGQFLILFSASRIVVGSSAAVERLRSQPHVPSSVPNFFPGVWIFLFLG